MFESLGNYIMKGVLTFALLVLSSYEGNDASFNALTIQQLDKAVKVEIQLNSAFEKDFEEIFKAGKSIDIWFHASVSSQGTVLEEEKFCHTVTYNPLLDSYLLKKGADRETIVCLDYECLKEELSIISWQFRLLNSVSEYDFSIYSYLDKIYFEQMDKEFNLMLLWKNKSPRLNETIVIQDRMERL